ncbi:hypothetical protein I4U23_005180 [Adineta vaga]|nr:hypothetical protein I4U23_005180 [Adineta vaga]
MFERTDQSVTVPNNDVARLMYYLNCVCVAIDCANDSDIQRFTNYNNWHHLSIEEQKALLVVCYAFSPDVLNNRVFFQSDALCGDSSNQFYKISQVRNHVVAAESIIIAGRVLTVNKIMTYKLQWMRTYYFNPMEGLLRRIANPPQHPALSYTYTAPVVRQSTPVPGKCIFGYVCCGIIYCVLFVIPGIIGLIIGLTKK